MFYSDETMHKIYEENEDFKYNLEYRIPKIFVVNVTYKIIMLLFDWLINFQDDLIKLKNNLNTIENKEKDSQINSIKNKLDINEKLYIMADLKFLKKIKPKKRSIKNKKENNEALIETKDYNTLNKNDNKNKQASKIKKKFTLKKRIGFYSFTIIILITAWYFISSFCSVYADTQKYLLYDFLYSSQINIINCFIISFIFSIIKIIFRKGEYSYIKNKIYKISNFWIVKFFIEVLSEFLIMKIINYKILLTVYSIAIYLIVNIIIIICCLFENC